MRGVGRTVHGRGLVDAPLEALGRKVLRERIVQRRGALRGELKLAERLVAWPRVAAALTANRRAQGAMEACDGIGDATACEAIEQHAEALLHIVLHKGLVAAPAERISQRAC